MRTHLYTGRERHRDLDRLVSGFATLRVPICVVCFDGLTAVHSLAAQAESAPIDLLHIRLPGLGLPRRHAVADELISHTALDILGQIIASGDHRLVILHGFRKAVDRDLLDEDDLRRLIRDAQEGTEIAMT